MKKTTKDKVPMSKPLIALVVFLILAVISTSSFIIYKIAFPTQESGGGHKEITSNSSSEDNTVTKNDKYESYMEKTPFIESETDKEDSDNPSKPDATTDKASECEEFVSGLMSQMSLSEKIYQLMFVRPETITGVGNVVIAGETTKASLEKYPVGGLVYFASNLESREQTIQMIQGTQSYSAIPLFIGVDEEGGDVSRLGSNPAMGTTKQPAMSTIGAKNSKTEAYNVGKQLAADLSALGFNVDFAPCADVLVNKDNSEIGNRSFSSDPKVCSNMVANVVPGLEENNVSATLKHFPGHGSTYTNSHNGRSESERTIEELRKCEFLPFEAGIENGVDFIMVSHMSLVNATEEKIPSSLSKEVITDMLINELGYEGIIITDSLEMGAITKEFAPGMASVKAINAGADMLLMTPNVKNSHDAIMNAIKNGEITEERINESVKKILTLKYEKGMMRKK
ncbi:MAG: hypothetical protein IJB70_00660 [Clostridia bacterium]|nr:hypothetical protein [Clostridia bacterium]